MEYEKRFIPKPVYFIADTNLAQLFLEVYQIEDYDHVNRHTPHIITKNYSKDVEETVVKILHTDAWISKSTWYLLTDMCNRELIPEGIYVITYTASKLLR